MNCKPVLYDTIAREKAVNRGAEAMRAALESMGWTERRPGVFGVGPGDAGDEEQPEEQLSSLDSPAA